ncbi:hypothetical protein [Sporosarcina sp. NPDC096371]|uniref:hypothetical protein n=1 Tax=Sporosarcina sp. NPDC096371 TaxID=3364530 RepID=UPI00382CB663
MNKKESLNWEKGAILGFYTYMLLSAINYFYYISTNNGIFSPSNIFWSGLLVAFLYDFIVNLKDKFGKKTR